MRAETLAAIAGVWSHLRQEGDPPLVAAIEHSREVLGENDPMTLRARYVLGRFRGFQGVLLWMTYKQSLRPRARRLYDEGLKILIDVRKRQEESLGNKHADTLRTTAAVGKIYCFKGETRHKDMYREAVHILEPLVESSTSELGKMHPVTLEASVHLGNARLAGWENHSGQLIRWK